MKLVNNFFTFSFRGCLSSALAILGLVVVATFFIFPVSSRASVLFSENFDSFLTGNPVGQNSWTSPEGTQDYLTISNTESASGANSLRMSNSINNYWINTLSPNYATTTDTLKYFSFNTKVTDCVGIGSGGHMYFGTEMSNVGAIFWSCDDATDTYFINVAREGNNTAHSFEIPKSSWNNIIVKYDYGNQTITSYLGGTQVGFSTTTGMVSSGNHFDFWAGYYTYNVLTYIDDLQVSTDMPSSLIPVNTPTHIISFSPDRDEVIASTTPVTFTASAYINADDVGFIQGIRISLINTDLNRYLPNLGSNNFVYFDRSPSAGVWNYSTTTGILPVGTYKLSFSIVNNYIGGVFVNPFEVGGNTLSESQDDSNPRAQYHQWKVDKDSLLGGLWAAQNNQFESYLSSTSTASSTVSLQDCSPVSFDFTKCVTMTFQPTSVQVSNFVNGLYNNVFTVFPFGYIARFYNIISTSSAVTLPQLIITIPISFPGSGQTLNLSPWGKLMGAGSILATATSTQTGVTFYNSFSPYWNKFVYFVFGLMCILEIIGLNSIMSFGFGGGSKEPSESKKFDNDVEKRRRSFQVQKEALRRNKQ